MRKTLLAVLLAAVVYTAIIIVSDAGEVWRIITSISPWWIPLFLALAMANYSLRFLKWHYFLRRIGVVVPLGQSLSIFIAGFSMTLTPGKLGELLKCYLLRRLSGTPVSVTSPVVIAERVTDLISMILLAVCGLVLVEHGGALPVVVAGTVFVGAVMFVLLNRKAFGFMVKLLCRFSRIRKHKVGFQTFQESCSLLLDTRSLAVTVPLGMVSWGCEAVVLILVSIALGVSPALSLGLALLAHSAGTIAGAVSMIPGGLGLTEITIGAILASAMPEADAAASTLIMRFSTIWFAVVIGIGMLGILKRQNRSLLGAIGESSVNLSDPD